MRIRSIPPAQSIKWFSCGWRFCKKELGLWVISSILFVVGAWLLTRIPLAGVLMFVFCLPIVAASTFLTVQEYVTQTNLKKKGSKGHIGQRLQRSLEKSGKCLFGVLGDVENIIAIVAFSTIAFVAVLLINIISELTAGSARLAAVSIFDVGWLSAIQFLGSRLLTLTLYSVVISMLFYAIPLNLFSSTAAFEAILYSIRACIKNWRAFFAFLGIMASPFLVIHIIASFSGFIGSLLMVIVGILSFPIIICSSYCSYKLMFN